VERNIIGVTVHRNAGLDDGQRHAFPLQIPIIGADEGSERCSRGMAEDD